MKKENPVRGEVLRIILKESSSRGGASRKITTGREPGQGVTRKRKGALGQGLRWPMAWYQTELKISWYGYNQGKNQGINPKSQVVLLKA